MIRLLSFLLLLLAAVVLFKGAQLLLSKERHTGVWRTAYTISGFWLGVPLLLMLARENWQFDAIDQQAWVAWALLAAVPNALFWALIWILRGFKRS